MVNHASFSFPSGLLKIMNNLYEIDRKLSLHGDPGNAMRNIEKIRDAIPDAFNLEFDIFYEDPMGQSFKETRTDLDATITGGSSENLYVIEVIKPIVRFGKDRTNSRVIQKGTVIVQAKNSETGND